MTDQQDHRPIEKRKLMARARRMEGQATGVVRMLEAERPCGDVLQQIVALTSAAQELSVLLIQDHVVARCGDESVDGQRLGRELSSLLKRALGR